jgi:hypothetical protein
VTNINIEAVKMQLSELFVCFTSFAQIFLCVVKDHQSRYVWFCVSRKVKAGFHLMAIPARIGVVYKVQMEL